MTYSTHTGAIAAGQIPGQLTPFDLAGWLRHMNGASGELRVPQAECSANAPFFGSCPAAAGRHEAQRPLTARELDVLRLIAKGYKAPEVASVLDLSPHTVRGYVREVYRKLGISSRAEAALEAVQRGLAS